MTANQIIKNVLLENYSTSQISVDEFDFLGYKIKMANSWAIFECNDREGRRWEYRDSYNQKAFMELKGGMEKDFISSVVILATNFKRKI